MSELGEVVLTVDEFESVRLSDFEGLYHASAAERMDVSRQTFGRIISSARRKVAEALVEGKALRIDGGEFRTSAMRLFECEPCGNTWEVPQGTGRPANCPQCHGEKIRRANKPEQRYEESGCRNRVREYPPEE